MRLGTVYSIQNTVTGERYIGFTRDIKNRKNAHFSALRNNSHPNKKMQKSVNKHGISNFSIEILESDVKIEDASKKERYWIDYYDCFVSGFNISRVTGAVGNTRRPQKQLNQWEKLRPTREALGMTQKEMADIIGVGTTFLSCVERGERAFSDNVDKIERFISSILVETEDRQVKIRWHIKQLEILIESTDE